MNDRERTPSERAPAAAGDADEFERLRRLIAAPERERLGALEQRLEGRLVDAESVARVLPGAIRSSVESGDTLAHALTPAVQTSLVESVRRDPSVLANALAPTIGAAIRKAIASALAGMLESFNRTLDHSLSVRSLGWRLEAWRTQRPFAEVVMLRTLRFKVEQVFLIHRESGLLLQHVVAPRSSSVDADLVSGMLTAIQDFVARSFAGDSDSRDAQLEEIEFGDRRVVIASGASAVLAAVTRGFPPSTWRRQLQETVERTHAECAAALAEFAGESAAFDVAAPAMEELLVEQRAESRRSPVVPVLGLVLLLVLLLVPGLAVSHVLAAQQLTRTLERARTAFEREPGYVLVQARIEDEQVKLVALRSPEARSLAEVLESSALTSPPLDVRLVNVQFAPEAK